MDAPELKTFRAFAEALIPPGGALPGAEVEGGITVTGDAARILASVSPRMRLAFGLALRVLERSTFPRRFSRLPLERRTRKIERLEKSGSMLLRNLVLLVKGVVCVAYTRTPEVQRVVGSAPRCELAPGAVAPPLPPHLNPAALEPPEDGTETCDAVVVGSGAGGAAAARVLAEAGLDVLVVEEGEYHDAITYSRDPIDALATLYRDGGLTALDGRPPIAMPVGRCVGGTTVINSGTCFRAPSEVLVRWREEHGIPWAADLDGEYEALERDLEVVPVRRGRAGMNAELCRAGAEALGASNGPIPRNTGGVECCGTCPTGCALDAKRAMHVSELPRAADARARIRAGVRIERVTVEGGRAVGVTGRTRSGRPYRVRARAVVLAGGALGTPELLLAQGIRNRHIGRHLRVQPACWVGARFPDREVNGWDGVMQSWRVDEWLDRGLFLEATFTPLSFGSQWLRGAGARFKERLEGYGQLAVIGVHLADTSEGRVRVDGRGRTKLGYRLTRDDAQRLRFGIARAAQIHFAAGAAEAYPQVGALDALKPGQEDAVESGLFSPSALRLEAFHPMGTARMGSDPRRSVVDPSGRSHDLPGLYVADASVLPTALGANPMLTIMACARHIARGLAAELA
ncbi:MAG TPA: GMC family oxidoreductase [Thermoleophilaceae bacterium]|jgi:choline dehydrogenase-like flavoprotein